MRTIEIQADPPFEQRKYLMGDLLQSVAVLTQVDFMIANFMDGNFSWSDGLARLQAIRNLIRENLQQIRGD